MGVPTLFEKTNNVKVIYERFPHPLPQSISENFRVQEHQDFLDCKDFRQL